eukprot:jgi/Psemu1/62517/estExt_Genemark1.C_30066
MDPPRCLVMGASNPTSIGFRVAETLLQQGASHVAIVGRNPGNLDRAVWALQQGVAGAAIIGGIVGDLRRPETMGAVAERASELMGGGIDVVVCCGGNGYSEYLGLDVGDPQSYRIMQDVAVLSPMFLIEACAPYLAQSRAGGSAVVVGSVAADVPWPNTAPYNFASAARNTMVKTLAFKYRTTGVRVNGVLAGVIHTGALDAMAAQKQQSAESYAALRASAQPMQKCGTPRDVANAVLYLASPASGFTTGELLRVDGGLHLSSWWNKPAMLQQYQGGGTNANHNVE